MLDLEVTLSDWVFNAIAGDDVLTLNRRYFQLRKPLERRLYELARKQCGTQPEWKCGLDKLKERTGSTSSDKEFRRLVRAICKADEEHNHLPDYAFRLDADILTVKPKPEFLESYAPKPEQDKLTGGYVLPLSPDTLEQAPPAQSGCLRWPHTSLGRCPVGHCPRSGRNARDHAARAQVWC